MSFESFIEKEDAWNTARKERNSVLASRIPEGRIVRFSEERTYHEDNIAKRGRPYKYDEPLVRYKGFKMTETDYRYAADYRKYVNAHMPDGQLLDQSDIDRLFFQTGLAALITEYSATVTTKVK